MRKDAQGQARIDLHWSDMAGIIRDCVFPTLYIQEGKRRVPVSMTLAKMLLAIIHGHAGGRTAYLSFDTLAAKSGKSTRQVKRAVEALQEKGVLLSEYRRTPSGVACNHYTIIWDDLGLLVPRREKSATSAEKSATSAEKSATSAETGGGESATGGTQSARVRKCNQEARAVALRNYPDVSGFDFANQEDVRRLWVLIMDWGLPHDLKAICVAAATTARKARPGTASGFFLNCLIWPHAEYAPADEDGEAGGIMCDAIMAHRYVRSSEWETADAEEEVA